ncbi:MAG: hypothetical protein HKM04_11440 [Legionellales bacterium]|nr:hypothetical protein [Legionellales bacterium]
MNNFTFHTPSTVSYLAIVCSLAIVSTSPTLMVEQDSPVLSSSYQWGGALSTFQSHLQEETYNIETVLTNFYSLLLEKQEPLGDEFAKVLYENLWDLYQS